MRACFLLILFLLFDCPARAVACNERGVPPSLIDSAPWTSIYKFCASSLNKSVDIDLLNKNNIFTGLWFDKGKKNLIEISDDSLEIKYDGSISTAHPSLDGRGMFLSGRLPFYVSVIFKNSICSSEAFSAVWLMPRQHNLKQEDVYPGDLPGFERWFELDIDEGGFSKHMHSTAISWSGIWPNYKKIQNSHIYSPLEMRRCDYNEVGVYYDPVKLYVEWWLNGVKQSSAGKPYVPDVAKLQDFYLIIGAQRNKAVDDFTVHLKYIEFFQPVELNEKN